MSSYIAPDFWQFYITSYQMLWRDWEMIKDLGIKNWVFDDAHFFRHHSTKTARIVKFLTKDAERIVLATATPKQKSTMDLHSLLEALGLNHIFGSEIGFENHYCVMRKTRRTLRDGRQFWQKEEVGLRNPHELKRKLEPFLIKRTFAEVGKELPGLIVKPVWLKLYPKQQEIYNQARNKIIQAWDKGEIKQIPNKGFHSLIQSCVGTRVVGLEEDISIKADAVMQFIDDKLGEENEKLIVYSFYKEPIRTLIRRLRKAGRDDYVLFTGEMNKIEKEQARREFQYSNKIRILLATGAAEMGINLQSARYLIMMNLILNSQRMIQLVGRLRRLGSEHSTVVVYPLLGKGTIEERLWDRLKYENALTDYLFDEKGDVFPSLSSVELMTMLRNG
jgi:SNF2 family DNA or RNA helicase